MSRIVAAAACVALLGACQSPPARPDPAVREHVRALKDRILVLRARLALRRNRADPGRPPASETSPAGGPAPEAVRAPTPRGSSVDPSATAAHPATATRSAVPSETRLHIAPDRVAELEGGAALLANLPREQARTILRDNWRNPREQAQTLRLLVTMRRSAAESILAGMTPRLVRFDANTDRLRAYSPDHAHADTDGYVTIQVVRTPPVAGPRTP